MRLFRKKSERDDENVAHGDYQQQQQQQQQIPTVTVVRSSNGVNNNVNHSSNCRKRSTPHLRLPNGHSSKNKSETNEVTNKNNKFETFCSCTSLHGWKYLSSEVNKTLRFGWVAVVAASMGVASFFLGYSFNDFLSSTVQTTQDTSRASLDNVFFPSVTLCNINQGRRSFFLQNGLNQDGDLLHAVLGQAYFGLREELTSETMARLNRLFASEEVMRKGVFTDLMYSRTTSKAEAKASPQIEQNWRDERDQDYVKNAGWYFKTLAAQEPGEQNVLFASYGKEVKDTSRTTDLLPFFGTDYGLCSLVKPQISFNKSLEDLPFETLMTNYSRTIKPGIQLGKENGLTLLLDAEVYDYAFSPQRGEGFKLAIHSHMDQPIMALSDIDLSPGFVTQLSVTPTLRDTTDSARWRFTPEERGCYFDGELEFKHLPGSLYRYGLSNCLFAATYDQILEQCGCVPYFHTMAWSEYGSICAGTALHCMNRILRDIGSHTHVKVERPGGQVCLAGPKIMSNAGVIIGRASASERKVIIRAGMSPLGVEWKPCLFACVDQSYTTSVTTSTFPNMHTFLRGREFCLMLHKLASSCNTSKNATLDEQYPGMCRLIKRFPELCFDNNANADGNGVHRRDADEGFGDEEEEDVVDGGSSGEVPVDVLKVLFANQTTTERKQALKLLGLLHRYARENLLLANIYIKDPAVTLIKRDQKVPVIWFIANVGGILGLCMGCSLVTIFEVLHHVLLVFLNTGRRSVNKIQKTIRQTQSSPSSTNRMSMEDSMVLRGLLGAGADLSSASAAEVAQIAAAVGRRSSKPNGNESALQQQLLQMRFPLARASSLPRHRATSATALASIQAAASPVGLAGFFGSEAQFGYADEEVQQQEQ